MTRRRRLKGCQCHHHCDYCHQPSRMIWQMVLHLHYYCRSGVVVQLLLLSFLSITTITTTSAFVPARQIRRLPTSTIITTTGYTYTYPPIVRSTTSSHTRTRRYSFSRYTSFNGAYSPDEHDTSSDVDDESKENEDETGGWLRWMMGGKPRGTNKVVHREAKELGGVPRSDRYSSRDWFHSTITLPNSAILRDIRNPVLAVTSWATFWSLLHHYLLKHSSAAVAAHLYLPSAPHSLMMSALGLLLVFRTNSAYQRFAEGRQIWERIINASRDLYRMIMLYEEQITVERRRRLQRLLAAFPYLLRHRIRPNLVMYVRVDDDQVARDPDNTILLYQDSGPTDYDAEAAVVAQAEEQTGMGRRKQRPLYWVDKRTLPWRLLPPGALEKCCQVQNRPLWCCDRMAMEIRQVPDGPAFAARERLALISHVNKLSACVGGAERIHQTVVPLNYARHTLRALTLWLFSLPFAVMKDLKLLTGPVLFLVSWLLFGVYEIGYSIEDPFQGSLRLSILCDTIRRDVLADELARSTAFELSDTEPKSHRGVVLSAPATDEAERAQEDGDDLPVAAAEFLKEAIKNEQPDAYQ